MASLLLPYAYAKYRGILIAPAQKEGEKPRVFYRLDCQPESLLEVQRHLDDSFDLEELHEIEFQKQLTLVYESNSNTAQQVAESLGENVELGDLLSSLPKPEDLLENEDDAPIIRLLNALFTEAIKQNSSDIHIEPFESHLVIRYRIDGVLREVLAPPRAIAPMLVSRIKVMAKLDIAEKRLPQDGRIALQIGGRNVDLRISTLPTTHGERVVMRILDKQQANLQLENLGMSELDQQKMLSLISQPHGILLVTGPTGSGKTTTLYTALTHLNTTERNILTVEDPIEYDLPGVGQTQVNLRTEFTFAKGLRAMLRQDPDVVMVGEIRDLETAETAVQASLTGHLVLSTLHTNSAIGAITRLQDMGVEPFLLASSLIGIVAQRLVRLLCPHCKQAVVADPITCQLLGWSDVEAPPHVYEHKGCEKCAQIGYSGRTGIYEIITIDDTLREMIHEKLPEQQLEKYIRPTVPSIQSDGIRRVLAGKTSLEEILRVTSLKA